MIVIIGGGIAGLATAWHVARAGGTKVCLLEREALLGTQATGHNAAIFRHADHDATGTALAIRSRELVALLGGSDGALLQHTGALFLGTREKLDPIAILALRFQLTSQRVDAKELVSYVPALAGGDAGGGLFVADDGVLDVHRLVQSLAHEARRAGVTIRTGVEASRVLVRSGRAVGVALEDGETVHADAVVVAAGAWASAVGATCEAPLPIEPRRRHLVMLVGGDGIDAASPVVWRLDDEVYFRPETGGVLACPCDEDPWPPGEPPCAPEAIARLADRLARVAPRLAELPVRRAWACLRTLAPDRRFVVGEDPRVAGLIWLAALGGHGMTTGLALGEIAAAAALGDRHLHAPSLLPGRLLPLESAHAS